MGPDALFRTTHMHYRDNDDDDETCAENNGGDENDGIMGSITIIILE